MFLYTNPFFKKFRRNDTKFSTWYFKKKSVKQLTTGLKHNGGRTQTGKKSLLSKGKTTIRQNYKILNYTFKYFKTLVMLTTVQHNSKSKQHAGLFVNSFGCWFYSLFPSTIAQFDYFRTYAGSFKRSVAQQYMAIWPRNLKDFDQYSKVSFLENSDGRVIYSRSAGVSSLLLKNDYCENFALVVLPSKKLKIFFNYYYAFPGIISSFLKNANFIKKAGFFINRGRKPTVRGTVKNSCDHPNGGRTRALRLSLTPWAKVAKKSRSPKLVLKVKKKNKRILKSKHRYSSFRDSYFNIRDSYYINILKENFFLMLLNITLKKVFRGTAFFIKNTRIENVSILFLKKKYLLTASLFIKLSFFFHNSALLDIVCYQIINFKKLAILYSFKILNQYYYIFLVLKKKKNKFDRVYF